MSGIDKSEVLDLKKQTKNLKIIKICMSSSNFLQIFQFHKPILQPVTSLKRAHVRMKGTPATGIDRQNNNHIEDHETERTEH